MTVTNTDNKDIYSGDGVTVIFAYTFKVLEASDMGVTVTDTLGVNPTLTLVLNTDFTIDNIGNDAGGDVTLLLTGQLSTAPIATDTITLLRTVPITQNLDLVTNDDFPSQSQEDAFDKLTFIAQQLDEVDERQLTLPPSVTGVDNELPFPIANKALLWNATADAIINSTDDFDDIVTDAAASAAAAAASETNAATSASSAASSASAASTSASAAAASAAAAAASAASVNLPPVAFPANEGQILVARAAASPFDYALEANLVATIDQFTIINPTGNLEVAPFMLDNIVLNAMRISSNNALTVQNLSDGVEDTYTDETGINATPTVNETFEGGSYRTQVGTLAENTKLILNWDDAFTGSTEFVDSSGNNHVITQAGSAAIFSTQFKFGDGSLCLDGTSQYLTIPNSADFDVIASLVDSWTIDMWVYHNIEANAPEHWVSHGINNNLWDFLRRGTNGRVMFSGSVASINMFAPSTNLRGDEVKPNGWHHVAVSKVNDVWGIYLDGVQTGHRIQTAVLDTTSTLFIGSSVTVTQLTNGYIDDLRISKADEFGVVPIAVPEGWWPLKDNAVSTTVEDWSGNTNTGTCNVNTDTIHSAGKVRNSFDFNSINRVVINTIVSTIENDTSGTVTAWINPTSIAASQRVFAISNSGANTRLDIFVALSTGVVTVELVEAGLTSWTIDSTGVIAVDVWTHIAVVQDGTSPVIYINGVADTNINNSNNITHWLNNLIILNSGRIGNRIYNGTGEQDNFSGRIEDVRYYQNVALSVTEINSIRDAGIAGVYGVGGPNLTVPTVAHTDNVNTHLLMHFDSATQGEDLIDSSTGGVGSPHTVTSVAGAGVSGKFGNGVLRLNGSTDRIFAPDSVDWDIAGSTADSWTIGCWIRNADVGNQGQFIGQQVDGTNFWAFTLNTTNDLTFRVLTTGDGAYITMTAGSITDNDWHYVTMIKVANDWGTYLDGVQIAFDTEAVITSTYTASLEIGGATFSSQWFDGEMDDVHISHDNLLFSGAPVVGLTDTITVPTAVTANVAGTVLHLLLNSNDESPFNNKIVFIATTLYDNANPKFGAGAVDFNGTTGRITSPDSTNWDIVGDPKEDWTIDLWVKHTDHALSEAYIAQREDGNNRWAILHTNATGIEFFSRNTAGIIASIAANGEITDTLYHHIALIKVGSENSAGSEYGLYLDGIQVGYVQSALFDTFTAPLVIGYDGSANFFDGQMDGIRIAQTNVIFAGAPNVGLTDTITIPTSAPSPIGSSAPDLLLQSTAAAVVGVAPDTIQAYFDLEDIDPTVLLNTDITLEVSRDGGTTFTVGTLALSGQQATAGRRLISAVVDVSLQPNPGVDLATIVYKVESANEIQFRLHASTRIWG